MDLKREMMQAFPYMFTDLGEKAGCMHKLISVEYDLAGACVIFYHVEAWDSMFMNLVIGTHHNSLIVAFPNFVELKLVDPAFMGKLMNQVYRIADKVMWAEKHLGFEYDPYVTDPRYKLVADMFNAEMRSVWQ